MKKLFTLCLLVATLGMSAFSQITWNGGMNISTNAYSSMHPRITLDAAGNPLVIWGRMSDESVFFSRWNGTMFTTPVKLNGSLTVATASWMGPDIASHGDTIYVVMKQTPESDSTSYIYIVHSFDGGITFSTPSRVDHIADSLSRFPTVTTDITGNPIVGFMKFNALYGDARWVVTKSPDHGNTFSTDVKASGWGGSTAVCDCCPGAILADGNNCAMLYRNNNNNIRDTWMGISTDNVNSFSNGCNVDNNNWMLMSCPSSGPDGIIVGDTLYSVFMNGASGTKSYLSKSSIAASTTYSVKSLTGNLAGLTQQNYPRIAGNGNAMAVVWKQIVSGSVQLPILFTNDITRGLPAAYDTVDLGDITNTDLALSNGKVFVVWEDDNTGTVKYRMGTFTPLTTGIQLSPNNINGITIFPNPSNDSWRVTGNSESNKVTATLYNTIGEVVTNPDFMQNGHSFSFDISNEGLPNGMYMLRLMSATSVQVVRLFKQ